MLETKFLFIMFIINLIFNYFGYKKIVLGFIWLSKGFIETFKSCTDINLLSLLLLQKFKISLNLIMDFAKLVI